MTGYITWNDGRHNDLSVSIEWRYISLKLWFCHTSEVTDKRDQRKCAAVPEAGGGWRPGYVGGRHVPSIGLPPSPGNHLAITTTIRDTRTTILDGNSIYINMVIEQKNRVLLHTIQMKNIIFSYFMHHWI